MTLKRNTIINFPFIISKALLTGLGLFGLVACASVESKSSNSLSGFNLYTGDFPVVSESELARSSKKNLFRVGDVAEISVYNIEALSNSYPVDPDGNISMPLIGSQKAAGLTPHSLQKQLVVAYSENYLQNPSIIVKRDVSTLGNVVVDGAVKKPGVFPLSRPIRLSEAVALAGGLSETADHKEVYMVREFDGKKNVKLVNLTEIRKMGADDPQIYPKDIVYIQNSTGKLAYDEFLKVVPLLSTLLVISTR